MQLRPAPPARGIACSNRDGLPLADQYDEPLASRHADVEQAALHAYCEI